MDWNGQVARLEIAFDITAAANEKEQLQKRLASEQVLLECVREFYRNRDMAQATFYALELAGRLFAADCAYVFSFQGETLFHTVEWRKEGVVSQIGNLQNISQAELFKWLGKFKNRENIVIEDVECLRETEAEEYAFFVNQGVERVLWVPLEYGGKLNGLIGLDNPARNLLENAVSFFQTLRYFMMLAISRNEDEEKLSRLSYHDTLTSFYNRNRYIQDIGTLAGGHGSLGVIYLDVNGLKEVNDHLGHDAGDHLLKACAQTVRDVCQQGSFYRIGGDEFVVICTEMDQEAFDAIVCRLRDAFAAGTCRAAIGSQWIKDCANIQSAIVAADEAMYADKTAFYQKHELSGRYRHQYEAFGYLGNPMIFEKKIESGRFLVYLQPKVEVESRRTVGAEALVRYQDESGQIVLPEQFLPVLESARLIGRLDLYIFETVCAKLDEWKRRGKEIFPISCNFSHQSFAEPSLVESLEACCERYGVPKTYLGIEIAERTDNIAGEVLTRKIDQLRKAGFSVSIKDIGLACSNLARLSKASFDVLKIDQSFVQHILTNEHARALVETVVGVCKKMEIHLIVEGVEREEQLAMIAECGVRIVQGFLFRQPIPIEAYEDRYLDQSD